MADNEKRILIEKVGGGCRAKVTDCDALTRKDSRTYCIKNGKWVSITEKDCKKCKSPILAGISRAEAVERMGEAFIKYDRECDKSKPLNPYEAMEAALDALLGKDVKNEK